MNFLDNITFRRKRTLSEPKDQHESNIISQSLNCTTSSMPDMSDDEDVPQLKVLKDEIARLTSQLNSAHKEIEVLSLENSNLKKINEEFNKKNDIYKKIVSSPGKIKAKSSLMSPKKITKTKQTQTSPISQEHTSIMNNNKTKNCEKNISSSRQNIHTVSTVKQPYPSKHKICLISSETSNWLYKIAERKNMNDYEICHYRKPRCGLRYILDNVERKVLNFTLSDFCVIYIGEEDFRKTHNYLELVMFIREKLLPLSHTNFIICLPTFKYMTNANLMFNSRIENFNNLLYLDNITWNYACILDSNLNLPYDYYTYSKHYGNLNSNGTKFVIADLHDLIVDLCGLNTTHPEVYCHSNENQYRRETSSDSQLMDSQFFL